MAETLLDDTPLVHYACYWEVCFKVFPRGSPHYEWVSIAGSKKEMCIIAEWFLKNPTEMTVGFGKVPESVCSYSYLYMCH